MTIQEAIHSAACKLLAAGIPTGRRDAEVLLAHILGKDRAWLIAHDRDALGYEGTNAFDNAVGRRAKREPLQHIVGRQEFWGLEFTVTPDVLIPRPETELIIESALGARADKTSPFLAIDMCTGSGCIAVSLAHEFHQAQILAVDRSEKALTVARENARKNSVEDRVRFLEGDLFKPLEALDIAGQVAMIVSNPPYVPSGDIRTLQPEVRDFEPEIALTAGPVGTEIHARIIRGAPAFLIKQGVLIMEMGVGQAEALVQMVHETGAYEQPKILKDLAGIERVIIAEKKQA